MIQLFRVSKEYGRFRHALAEVTCTIERGEFVFLTGPSGGGGPSGASVVVVSLIEFSGLGPVPSCKAGAENGLRTPKMKGRRQNDPLSSQIVPVFTARRSASRSVFRAMT